MNRRDRETRHKQQSFERLLFLVRQRCGNRPLELFRFIGADPVSLAVSHDEFHSIEARHVEKPAARYLPNTPPVIPRVPHSPTRLDVLESEPFSNETRPEPDFDRVVSDDRCQCSEEQHGDAENTRHQRQAQRRVFQSKPRNVAILRRPAKKASRQPPAATSIKYPTCVW